VRLAASAPPRLGHVPAGLPSFPVVPGSVQLTPSSELVVLGPDAGVTGGYPVLGVVRSQSLDALAQCRPGSGVRLRRRMRRSPDRGRGSAVKLPC
jgi:allophanate hydrolase subunit 2